MRALRPKSKAGVVAVVLNAHLTEVLHLNREGDIQLVEVGVPKVRGEVMVEDVVVECHSSSSNSMVALLNIKVEEGVGLLNMVAVVGMAAVAAWGVAVKADLLVAHPDFQFPSCTKLPRLHIKPG